MAQPVLYGLFDRLTQREMDDVQEKFYTACTNVLSSMQCDENSSPSKWLDWCSRSNPVVSIRPDFFEQLKQKTFEDTDMVYFISKLHFQFFSTAGGTSDFIQRLCQNLIDGLFIDGYDDAFSHLPSDLKQQSARTISSQTSGLLGWLSRRKRKGVGSAASQLFLTLRNSPWIILYLLASQLNLQEPASEAAKPPQ